MATRKQKKAAKPAKGGAALQTAADVIKEKLTGKKAKSKGTTGQRRRKSITSLANEVLRIKLQRKIRKLKYGGL